MKPGWGSDYRLGRVSRLHAGADGRVRAVDISHCMENSQGDIIRLVEKQRSLDGFLKMQILSAPDPHRYFLPFKGSLCNKTGEGDDEADEIKTQSFACYRTIPL